GNFIGEAVICEFDFRGSANLGIRLLPAYTGKGFGKEAFSALADYAIYVLGLSTVTAYCFKQNISSFHMLSSCMTLVKEDEKYYYFKKTI
ncbi:MAG: GNAT family N-acetyltransferase, partial [Oscillospiraceae bacterium]|nr:GNAT family N-acetyltransferase [Oscillospiraceae bacterium]